MSTLLNRCGDYLLEKALASECKQAGLTGASVRLSFGTVDYLRSRHAAASEAVVMLHGAAADKTSWTRFARHLGGQRLLVIPDLPGHGNSCSDLGLCYSIGAQAERLRELLSALGIARVHLIGNSMGGTIAVHLAATAPQLVASLVLIDAAGFEASPSWLRQHVATTGTNPMIELHDAAGYRTMMGIGMAAPPYIPGLIVSALARALVRRRAINRKIIDDIGQDLDQTASLAAIAAPALIIWGAADKVEHVDNAELLHRRLADSRKIVMPGIGHVPMVEAPKQVAAACTAFFAGSLPDLRWRTGRRLASPAPPTGLTCSEFVTSCSVAARRQETARPQGRAIFLPPRSVSCAPIVSPMWRHVFGPTHTAAASHATVNRISLYF